MKSLYTYLVIILLATNYLNAQVNAFAKVTAIDGTNKILDVSNVNQTYDLFAIGERVLIYHTQGNVVTQLSDNISFGQIGTVGNTGRIEIATISNIVYNLGIPSQIILNEALTYIPEIGSNSTVQIVSYPTFTNYSTTANITATPWNGNVGGIIAFSVAGKLTLNHDISANGAGFRGGARSISDNSVCTEGVYRTSSTIYGTKGEGIFKISSNTHRNGKNPIANGGGGGNLLAAGGGGGGNFSSGGKSGFSIQCTSPTSALGGYSLSNEINLDLMIAFLGGAGGGGQRSNDFGSSGANGGGLILIKTDTLKVVGNRIISANGNNASDANTQDGAGGGGAGGSILLKTNHIIADTLLGNKITVSANGGNGGNVPSSAPHGGGGGGAVGMIKYIDFNPTFFSGLKSKTLAGLVGKDDGSNNPRITGTSGVSANGVIYFSSKNTQLPVDLLTQKVKCTSTGAIISWTTASEKNNESFIIEKSDDFKEWKFVSEIAGSNYSNQPISYEFEDENSANKQTYYRIRQNDYDGNYEYFDVLSILCKMDNKKLEIIGVNASDNLVSIFTKTEGFEALKASIYDMNGKELSSITRNNVSEGANMISFPFYVENGTYIVRIMQNDKVSTKKIVVQ